MGVVKKFYNTYLVNEFRTSCMCSKCEIGIFINYNESNNSISFQSCDIKLGEEIFYSMDLPLSTS